MKRIGVLGGSFNPPHNAHLQAAEIAAQELNLDQVVLVPCAVPAHKQLQGDPGPQGRLSLAHALAASNPDLLRVDPLEFNRPGPSYTADTLEVLTRQQPDADFHFILGFDQAIALPGWTKVHRMLELSSVAVVPRQELAVSTALVDRSLRQLNASYTVLASAPDDISSTRVRDHIIDGNPQWRAEVPPAVAALIEHWRLYRTVQPAQPVTLIDAVSSFGRAAAAQL
jgi:nicotinate-nucleotide adenylyltransferase